MILGILSILLYLSGHTTAAWWVFGVFCAFRTTFLVSQSNV